MSDCSTHAFEVPLKSCPFCSAEPEVLSDGRRTWGLVQHNEGCLFPVYPKHEIPESDFTAWNTRSERTCEFKQFRGPISDTDEIGDRKGVCSVCSAYMHEQYNYCPNCGAKVVGE